MSGQFDYPTWRLGFQSDAHAARAAFDAMTKATAELARAKQQLLAISAVNRSNFEDSAEYHDWAASRAAATLAELTPPPAPVPVRPLASITRGPGLCLSCKRPHGSGHTDDCYFAPFVVRRRA